MEEDEFPLGLAIASMVTTSFFAIMWPTGDDDLFWGGVISLPFYFLFLIRHLYLRGFRKTEVSSFMLSLFCSTGLWTLQFLAYGHPWHWGNNQFIISGIFALITPLTICAIAVANFDQPVRPLLCDPKTSMHLRYHFWLTRRVHHDVANFAISTDHGSP